MTGLAGQAGAWREVELKFHLPAGSRTALEHHPLLALAKARQAQLKSIYFDTPDLALQRCGLSLRVRHDGATWQQTVKSEPDGHDLAISRREWTWPINSNAPDLTCLTATQPLAKTAEAIRGRLQPVFTSTVRRTTRLVHLGDDTRVEVAFDEGAITTERASEPIRELELELKSGSVEPLYLLAAGLQTVAPIWLLAESKAARGWHLRSGARPSATIVRPPALKRSISAAAGFCEALGSLLGDLTANGPPTLAGDPEGLHQSRVAIRSVRALLQLFAPCLDDNGAGQFNTRLRTFARIFGTARDWDVFGTETLPRAMPALPARSMDALLVAAEAARQQAHAQVTAAITGGALSRLILELLVWANTAAFNPQRCHTCKGKSALAALAPALLERRATSVAKRGRHTEGMTPQTRHKLRKSIKTLSFAVACLAQVFPGKAAKRYHRRCKAVERILGAANDAAVTRRLMQQLIDSGQPELLEPARAIMRWNKHASAAALCGLEQRMRRLRKAPAFW